MRQPQKSLYLPSTPLNVFVSCAVALNRQKSSDKDELAQLWLIDQKKCSHNPYYEALKSWTGSPFESVSLFCAEQNGLLKLQHRSQLFSRLSKALQEFLPNQVAVGSDRRIEFQFVMQYVFQLDESVVGLYLDDGLYSYMGRPNHFFKDGINLLLKKLFYGTWWQEPKTVGASKWVNQAWLFSPKDVVEPLQTKSLVILEPEWFKHPQLQTLSTLLAKQLNYEVSGLADLDVMLLIPHPNNIKKINGYHKRIQDLVSLLTQQNKSVGVKYHPRSEGEDFLNLRICGASEIVPSLLAFEFCLPLFSKDCQIVGDIGTALMSCKWLRPELRVCALLDETDVFQKRFIGLTKIMGIRIASKLEESVL